MRFNRAEPRMREKTDMNSNKVRTLGTLVAGAVLGFVIQAIWNGQEKPAVAQTDKPIADVAALAKELETIKGKLPDQAHAMQDVGYHFSNLWFAGKKENWDLATFYLNETRSHLRWAVRIIPKRK